MFVPPDCIGTLPVVNFAEGDVLIPEGTAAAALYFLAEGVVEVVKGDVSITKVRDRGAMFGEMSVLLSCPHTATVRAATDVTCHVAREPMVFLATHPEAMFYVGKILAQRLESLNKYLVDVKSQLREKEGHVGMVDEVLGALMSRHPKPRRVAKDPGQ
ncbi:MAG TPA: cyclic nucleotide-binding domain-containing protein [Candidatus Hydrogenedentes bacterium]|nr:cyclic nucleotide-binding domain-containing protein [Candidatus Hydrogenedentota bacterium]